MTVQQMMYLKVLWVREDSEGPEVFKESLVVRKPAEASLDTLV